MPGIEGEPFDPDGPGYDEKTAAEIRATMQKLMDKPSRPEAPPSAATYHLMPQSLQVADQSNEGAFDSWVWHPEKDDWVKHAPSRDPREGPTEGLLLKGRLHPTWDKLVAGEEAAGYTIRRGDDGRYYSFKTADK